MSYLPSALGFELFQSATSPFFPGGLPGPVPPPPGGITPGPTMPASIFPTALRWGDVANVTGPFQSLHTGQVRVKFSGAPWMAPQILGPFSASVVVPDGSETGECAIEINGRRVFGTNCVITPASTVGGQVMRPKEHTRTAAWKDFGEKGTDGLGAFEGAKGLIVLALFTAALVWWANR